MLAIQLNMFTALMVLTAWASPGAGDEKIEATKLVGKWEETDGKEGMRARLEFTKDGTVTLSIPYAKDKYADLNGTYEIKGDKLRLNIKGASNTPTWTVIKLTEDGLKVEVEKGKTTTYKRFKVGK